MLVCVSKTNVTIFSKGVNDSCKTLHRGLLVLTLLLFTCSPIPLSVTLTIGQGHSSVKHFYRKCLKPMRVNYVCHRSGH